MIKLIYQTENSTQYWETWNDTGTLFVHFGKIGNRGTTETYRPPISDIEKFMSQMATHMRSQGYRDLNETDLVDYIIQYRLNKWGTEADLNVRFRIQSELDDALGWVGNGHCDGGDIGSGTMNVLCRVISVNIATRIIKHTLEKCGLLDGATLAIDDGEEYRVVYPHGGSIIL